MIQFQCERRTSSCTRDPLAEAFVERFAGSESRGALSGSETSCFMIWWDDSHHLLHDDLGYGNIQDRFYDGLFIRNLPSIWEYLIGMFIYFLDISIMVYWMMIWIWFMMMNLRMQKVDLIWTVVQLPCTKIHAWGCLPNYFGLRDAF